MNRTTINENSLLETKMWYQSITKLIPLVGMSNLFHLVLAFFNCVDKAMTIIDLF